jgi:sporulation protein YlmC with PRC-barrel domain
MIRHLQIGLLSVPILTGGVAWAQQAQSDTVQQQQQQRSDRDKVSTIRASQWMDLDVYDKSGRSVGEVEDVILDGGLNRANYVVVSYGGFMGMGDRLYAVPWAAFEHRPAEPGKIFLDIDENRLRNAPSFDNNTWPNWSDNAFRDRINTFYGWQAGTRTGATTGTETGTGANTHVPRGADQQLSGISGDTTARTGGTGTGIADQRHGVDVTAGAGNRPTWSRRVSQVIGADVKNSRDENLGEIEDLVFNLNNGDAQYAVLSFGGILGMGEKWFAIPMRMLRTTTNDDQEFVLDIDKDMLRNSPGFDHGSWPDFADPQFQSQLNRAYGDAGRAGSGSASVRDDDR